MRGDGAYWLDASTTTLMSHLSEMQGAARSLRGPTLRFADVGLLKSRLSEAKEALCN